MTYKTSIRLFLAVLALTGTSLYAQVDKAGDKVDKVPGDKITKVGDDKAAQQGLKFTGLPLVSYSTDDGFGYGLRAYGTYYEPGYAPYLFQSFGQYYKTTRGYEYHEFSLDYLKFLGTPLRIKVDTGFERTLNAQWYGYGNYHDLQKIKKIKEGEIPINENLPASRDVYQTQALTLNENGLAALARGTPVSLGSFNNGKEYLQDSQDKYYYYDRISPFFKLSSEDFFGDTNFKWFAGFRGRRERVQSYYGDTEGGDKVPNIKTLIDVEQPYGYDAVADRKYVNSVRLALAYDSRPRVREKNPNDGIFADIHFEDVSPALGSNYSFYRTTMTYRQYIEVLPSLFKPADKELVFAFRLQGQKAVGQVPFYEAGRIYTMNEENEGIGGNRGVRGYNANQFVDNVYAIANTELRLTTFKISALGGMDFVILGYYDAGRVAPTIQELDGKGIHRAVGAGLRIVWQKNTIINISSGRSEYGSNTNFSFDHMF
ncbi:MAG: BamA/TamA family outer membrane protein [Spirochaetia bacterium]|nr:BamA/TamA family outer membrane protein [Spirochaetia bacterium]